MTFEEMKAKLKDFEDKIDLSKKFPGYFNKWIFRSAIIAMLLLGAFIIVWEDVPLFQSDICLQCRSSSQCVNPFYVCHNQPKLESSTEEISTENVSALIDFDPHNLSFEDNPILSQGGGYIVNCEDFDAFECRDGVCEKEFLKPGEQAGRCPGPLYRNFGIFAIMIILMAFGINHLVYVKKKEGRS